MLLELLDIEKSKLNDFIDIQNKMISRIFRYKTIQRHLKRVIIQIMN